MTVVDSSLAKFLRSEDTVEALFLAWQSAISPVFEYPFYRAIGLNKASASWLRAQSLGIVGDSIGLAAAILLNHQHLKPLHNAERIFATGALSMDTGEIVVREVSDIQNKLAVIEKQPQLGEEAIVLPHKTIISSIRPGQRQIWLAGPKLTDIQRVN
jgi:hypothetical protein